ncbi:hypothetical protein JXA32_14085 [Candidatus Sumerlaeota bacterium]|nr:hypothetical protein [Candidatus Sumerlaeota bacterium]
MRMRLWTLRLLMLLVFPAISAGCYANYKRVLVMNFESATGANDADKLSIAVPEYIMTFMSGERGIVLLERQDINRFLEPVEGVELPKDSRLMQRRWKALGAWAGADYLIVGSVSKLDDNYTIVARLFSVEKGVVVPGSAVRESCRSEEEIFYQSQKVARAMTAHIHRRTYGTPLSPVE